MSVSYPMTDDSVLRNGKRRSATITKLKVVRATKPATKSTARAERQQRAATIGVGAVALTLTSLSLTHLTCGIERVTGDNGLASCAMAVGIDLGFVALEVAQVIKLPEATARAVRRFAHPAILGTMLASALLNAFGFAAHADGLMVYPAVALGCAIPALIYALTRVAVALAR